MVDSVTDEADVLAGVGGCLTAGSKCTLRAAIEESNSSVGTPDEIVFDEVVFDGQAASTIVLSSGLPAVVDPSRINGRECLTAAGVNGPCVGIDGPGSDVAMTIDDADGVEVEGLAVTGAQMGISIESSEFFRVRNSWFGVELDGSGDGNTSGIFVGPGSANGRIGGEGPDAGNTVVESLEDGLHIHGASNIRVLGNYFGVRRDGITPAANGKDIEVTSTEGLEAAGTTIGTRVSSEAAATAACDGGCNLISGAAASGIDLEGDGGQELPAVTTTIVGNYIGLNATGSASVPNAAAGINVGKAMQTVIGGPKVGEANRINGGSIGVLAGPAAGDLVVRGNLIGVDSAGTGSLAPPDEGIVVDSEELSSPAIEAVVADNEIRMEGGVAIAQQGFGARVSGNEIHGAATGIKTYGSTGEHGNLIEGNSLEGLEANGILVENNLNEILGNEISGASGAGIRIQGSLPFGVTENLIGGDAAAEENVITGSGGDAIEISNVEETQNEVARNRGIANGGLFIDLVALSPGTEPKGPNDGIEPPDFTTLTQLGASGSGARAGANVRVFGKRIAEAGELDSFLGEAIADAMGNWAVGYGDAIPAGTIVAVTQTSEAGGTSELAMATTPSGPSNGGGAGGEAGSGASGSADTAPPQTRIVTGPKRKSRSSTAWFKFSSDEPGSTFQCALDGKPFKACKSPKKYEGLRRGPHVFKVRAIDPARNADSSPAKKRFTVLDRAGG
jgi:copper-binding protein NosD